jgi:hypothetical protein
LGFKYYPPQSKSRGESVKKRRYKNEHLAKRCPKTVQDRLFLVELSGNLGSFLRSDKVLGAAIPGTSINRSGRLCKLWKACENRSVTQNSRAQRVIGLSASIRANPRRIFLAEKQMRPGPATQAASFVVSCAAFVTAWRRMTASARQPPRSFEPGVLRLPKLAAYSRSCDHEPATIATARGPVPAPCL